MHRFQLRDKKIVIWGTGIEALAAARYIRALHTKQVFTFVDEHGEASLPKEWPTDRLITNLFEIEAAVLAADVIIKSPGVSFYHPILEAAKARQIPITSLLNLWSAENDSRRVITITGTKGKSTTASLLTHVLQQLGQRVTILGNFGVPVTECKAEDFDYVILEVSSYQAANFDGSCLMGLITSLYPEHLDWHKSLKAYYTDKCQVLQHCETLLTTTQAESVMAAHNLQIDGARVFDSKSQFHFKEGDLYCGPCCIGALENTYLLRPHNQVNVCGVMALIDALQLSCDQALASMKYYKGLPHRQQEVGEMDGILYVDDSISTTPQSAVAALRVYAHRPITLIAGGQNRGIDFAPLSEYILQQQNVSVVCMGESGLPIGDLLKAGGAAHVMQVTSMAEALRQAKAITPAGGVILLSPASPSYDMFENYMARAAAFVKESGLPHS
ncbi:MAG: UDP-N-acetylmuramoyl-L-alanine--D-glutamate ligase [Alphaproteobacteria bacterium]|nr:UDP-N-acetylmuramoyl-L-alanine--D-glutamate ligase [Alphaproteobacteria bacterium]